MDAFALSAKLALDTSEFSSKLKSSESGFRAFGSKIASGAKKVAKLGAAAFAAVGAATVAFAKSAIDTGAEFDASMSQVAATMGMSVNDIKNNVNGAGDTFQALSEKARQMGAETNFSAKEAADGLNILAQSGYSAEESMEMIGDVLHLAAAGGMEMASSASYISQAMKGFGDSSKDAGYYADLMAKGATLANTNVQQLGEALGSSAAAGKTYGQSAQSVTVALLRLAEQGVTGSAAGTALAATMKNLYAPTNQAAKAMKKLGVSAYDSKGKARDVNSVINDLNKATKNMTAEQRAATLQTIFGIQGFNAYNKMISTSTDKQNKWTKALKNSKGEAAKQYKTMTDNLKGDIDKFNSAFDELKISVSEKLMPTVRRVTQRATQLVSNVAKAFKMGGLKDALHVFARTISDWVKKIKWPTWKDVQKSATKAWNGIKKGAENAAAEILGSLGIPIIKKMGKEGQEDIIIWPSWDDVKESAIQAWNNLKEKIANLPNEAGALVFGRKEDGTVAWPTWEDVKNAATAIWNDIKEKASKIAELAGAITFGLKEDGTVAWPTWEDVKDAGIAAWDAIKAEALKLAGFVFGKKEDGSVDWPTWEDVKSAAETAWNDIKDNAAKLSGLVFGDGQTVVNNIKKVFDDAAAAIKEIDWTSVGSSIYDLITAPFDALVSLFSTIFSNGKDEAEGLDWAGLGTSILGYLEAALTAAGDVFKGAFEAAYDKSVAVWTGIEQWFTENVINPIVATFNDIGSPIKQKFEEAWNLVKGVFNDVKTWFENNVVKPITDAINSITGPFQDVVDTIEGWLGKKNDKTITITTRHVDVFEGSSGTPHTGVGGSWDEGGGSHAKGSWNIPYDNYRAVLHRNEMVLTASQARQYREGKNSGLDLGSLSRTIVSAVREGMENAHVNTYLDGKQVTDNVSRRMANEFKAMRYAT